MSEQTRYVHIVWAVKHDKIRKIFGVYTSWAKALSTKDFIEKGMFEEWPLPQKPYITREKLE